jgi:hypothetical protein
MSAVFGPVVLATADSGKLCSLDLDGREPQRKPLCTRVLRDMIRAIPS